MESKEALEAELAMKVEEVTAREELIKKGAAMVEDLENRLEAQEDMVSKLEEAELVHAKELEAASAKLFEEKKKNEAVTEEMDNMQTRLSRAEEVEKHLDEMKAEVAKVEEQGKVIERPEETIADLQLEVKAKSETLRELSNLEEKLSIAE